jgi:hypothetical protein
MLTFVQVISDFDEHTDHESRAGIVGSKFVKKVVSVKVWSVIECESNFYKSGQPFHVSVRKQRYLPPGLIQS